MRDGSSRGIPINLVAFGVGVFVYTTTSTPSRAYPWELVTPDALDGAKVSNSIVREVGYGANPSATILALDGAYNYI